MWKLSQVGFSKPDSIGRVGVWQRGFSCSPSFASSEPAERCNWRTHRLRASGCKLSMKPSSTMNTSSRLTRAPCRPKRARTLRASASSLASGPTQWTSGTRCAVEASLDRDSGPHGLSTGEWTPVIGWRGNIPRKLCSTRMGRLRARTRQGHRMPRIPPRSYERGNGCQGDLSQLHPTLPLLGYWIWDIVSYPRLV